MLSSGDAVYAKDRLRFEVDLPDAREIMIVGVETSGSIYRCFPSAENESVALQSGRAQLVPDAVELDDSLGQESLNLIACPKAFGLDDLRGAPNAHVAVPEGCQTTSLILRKRAP